MAPQVGDKNESVKMARWVGYNNKYSRWQWNSMAVCNHPRGKRLHQIWLGQAVEQSKFGFGRPVCEFVYKSSTDKETNILLEILI